MGFTVVANEVRKLANKSAAAAKGTTALIEGAIEAAENGTRLADDTAKSLSSVADGTQEAANLVNQISAVIEANSAAAVKSAAASEELSGQPALLKKLVRKFTLCTESYCISAQKLILAKEAESHFLIFLTNIKRKAMSNTETQK